MRPQLPPIALNPQSVDDSKVTDHLHAIIPTGEEYHASADEQTIFTMIAHRFVEAFYQFLPEERMQVELTDGRHHFVWKKVSDLLLLVGKWFRKSNNEKKEGEDEELEKLPNILRETLLLQKC